MPELMTVTVSVVGLSSTDYAVLTVAARLLERNDIKISLLEKGDTSGSIILVDIDTPTGYQFYSQFNYERNRALLVFSTETLNDQRHSVLKKPVRVQTLRDVIFDFCTQLNAPPKARFQTSEPAIEQQQPEQPLDLDRILFFLLFKAQQEKQIVQIFCHPFSPLFVDAVNELVATTASREILHKMTRSHSCPLKSVKLSTSDFEVLAKGQLIIPLKNILWSAALYGSHGHLISGHSAELPIQLKAWPNLSRLECDLEHIKLASIMASKPLTLKQIVEKTQLPWNTVVGFYNAAYATGLIVANPVHLPTATSAPQAEPAKISLFAKIARRLKLAS